MSENDAKFLKLAAQRLNDAYDVLLSDIDSELNDDAIKRLVLAAPEMYKSLRDAVLFMQFLGKEGRPLSAEERKWLNNAAELLAKIEGVEK